MFLGIHKTKQTTPSGGSYWELLSTWLRLISNNRPRAAKTRLGRGSAREYWPDFRAQKLNQNQQVKNELLDLENLRCQKEKWREMGWTKVPLILLMSWVPLNPSDLSLNRLGTPSSQAQVSPARQPWSYLFSKKSKPAQVEKQRSCKHNGWDQQDTNWLFLLIPRTIDDTNILLHYFGPILHPNQNEAKLSKPDFYCLVTDDVLLCIGLLQTFLQAMVIGHQRTDVDHLTMAEAPNKEKSLLGRGMQKPPQKCLKKTNRNTLGWPRTQRVASKSNKNMDLFYPFYI